MSHIIADAPAADRNFHVGECYGHVLTAVVESGHLYARVRMPGGATEYPMWNPITAQMEQWNAPPRAAVLAGLESLWRGLLTHPALGRLTGAE